MFVADHQLAQTSRKNGTGMMSKQVGLLYGELLSIINPWFSVSCTWFPTSIS